MIGLWRAAGLVRPWNDPELDFHRKLTDSPWGLLVGELDGRTVVTAMAGYDGHRGSVNYLAVDPSRQRCGLGSAMMDHVEALLLARGCPKVNVAVRADNVDAEAFYAARGYRADQVTALGLRLVPDPPRD